MHKRNLSVQQYYVCLMPNKYTFTQARDLSVLCLSPIKYKYSIFIINTKQFTECLPIRGVGILVRMWIQKGLGEFGGHATPVKILVQFGVS